MELTLADYQNERDLFRTLLDKACEERILLFRGASGTGKTTLLQACQEELRQRKAELFHVPIQLRNGSVTVAEIFYRLGGLIGWPNLPGFVKEVAVLQEQPTVNIPKNLMLGRNQISVALQAESTVDRTHRRAALTDACFADLQGLQQPLFLVLDTYEDATTDVQQWIDGPFLARAAQNPQVRVLVAGQETPNPKNIEWGHCCQHRELFGVPEAQHWLPVVAAKGKRIDVRDPESWLAGICHALKGRPKDIMQVIETLPDQVAA